MKKPKSKFLYYTGLATLLFVVLAFGFVASVQPERIARYYKPFVTIHILTSMGWLVLFTWQSKLILSNKLNRHKQNKKIAVILVVIATIIGIYITYLWGDSRRLMGESRDILVFASLFFASIGLVNKGKTQAHKRLMLIAMLNLVAPAWTRVGFIFDWTPPVLVLAMILSWIIVPLAYDISTIRKIHRATIAGILVTIVSFAIVVAIIISPWFENIDAFIYPK